MDTRSGSDRCDTAIAQTWTLHEIFLVTVYTSQMRYPCLFCLIIRFLCDKPVWT